MSNWIMHPKAEVDDTSSGPSRRKLLDEVRARIGRLNYHPRKGLASCFNKHM